MEVRQVEVDKLLVLIDRYNNLGVEAINYLIDNNLENIVTLKTIERFNVSNFEAKEKYSISIPKYKYLYRNVSDNKLLTYGDLSIPEIKAGIDLGTIYSEAVKSGENKIEVYEFSGVKDIYNQIKNITFSDLFEQLGVASFYEYLDMLRNQYNFNCIEEYKQLLNVCYGLELQAAKDLDISPPVIEELCELITIIDKLTGREKLIDLREEFMGLKVISMVADINAFDIYMKIKKKGGVTNV